MPEQTTQTTNNTSHQSAADDVEKESLAAKSFKNLEPVKHFLSNIDYSYTKNAFVIDKGHIRSVEGVKNLIQGTINIMNDLSLNDYWLIDKNNMSEDLQKFSGEDFLSHLKDSDLANVGKNIDPVKDKMFMPIKVDVGNKIGKWYPVIINEDADSFKKVINGYQGYHDTKALKMLRNLLKRHTNANKGLFEASKIKFSNVDLNSSKKVLDDSVIKESKAKKIGKGFLNYVTGNSFFSSKRKKAKKFNKKYGKDEDGNKMGDTDKKDNDGTLVAKNIQADSGPEEKKSNNKEDLNSEIKERAKKFIENNLGMIPKGKLSMPFRKLTTKGLLADIRLSVKSDIIGDIIMTSSFNIEFGKTINLNYIGSEITGISEIYINLLDGKFIFQASVDNLVSDISKDDHTFKASNPTIKNKINGNEITLRANNLIYHTKSETFSGNGITGSMNVNFFGYNFNGQIKDLDFVDNKPTIGLGIGKINKLNFTSHFKAENIAATYILLENGDQQLVADTTIKINDVGPKGFNVSKLNGRLISNIDLSNISSSLIDIKNGVLEGTFLGNKININGFEYANNTKTFSAEKGNLDYNVFNHTGNIEIENPSYNQESGFSFSKIEAAIDEEVRLFNLFKFNNITLKATKENDVYGFGFSTSVSTEDIIGLTMFGQGVTIKSAEGNVNYDSEAEKKLTFNKGKISGNVAFGDGILDFNLSGIDNTGENFSIENLNGTFSYKSLGINNKVITGKNIIFSGSGDSSEMTYESIKASGLEITKDFGFIGASLNDAEIKNDSSNKEFLVGFTGKLKDLFPEMEDQQGDGSLSAKVSGFVGYDYAADKKIFKLTEIEASGTIVNPLNRLNELIGEFSSGRIDVGVSIPVFPLVSAEFGMFLEAAMKLGGSPITLTAKLSENVIKLSMKPFEIGSGHIAAGVYAGVQAGSKFIVSLALFLEAIGKASAKLEVSYLSILNFNSETGLPNITPKANTFHGFDYNLEAKMDLKAKLKAVATAFLIFKKSFSYTFAKANLGTLTYSSDKGNKQETPDESLVTDQKDIKKKGGVPNKYAEKSIKELIQINPKERFDSDEKNVIANKFKNENGNAEKDKEFNEGIDDTLDVAEKNHLIKVRELASKLTQLDQINEFQNNRFDWNVIIKNVESINSRLSAVTVEYNNNTTKNYLGSERFNYTKFGKVVKGEITDELYQEKLKNSINYIKDLDQVSQNFNTTSAFNTAHKGIFNAFKTITFENKSGFVESILNKRDNINKSQEKQINNLNSINSFKGRNLHSKSKSDLDQILSKTPLSENKLKGMEKDLLSPLKDYRKNMSMHEKEINFLRKEIISQEREINSGYYASKLASLSES